jgi:hypothetical protein
MSRSRRATRQQSIASAGGPGSRSKATTVGRSGFFASAREGWSSRAASCASQVSVATSSQTMKFSSPSRPMTIGAVFTHLGVCEGARFSKKRCPSTPSGRRTRVSGRPLRWGSIASETRA